MATQTSQTTDEISNAVNDISKGALSQVEDIETATCRVSDMGELIENIVQNIDQLNETSISMQKAGKELRFCSKKRPNSSIFSSI